MRVGILATGTELTMGQILNKNAQTLSELLYQKFGLETAAHITVPDDRQLILESLHFLGNKCDFIITTGGLGPTRDDFTRDLVAEWSNLPLEYDPKSWQHLTNQLSKINRQPKEIHRQECFFPKGAKIYSNFVGTANGFSVQPANGSVVKKVYVLPGPPKEIAGLWQNEIEAEFEIATQNLDRKFTESWTTAGAPESVIATAVENAIKECPFEIGYRLNSPQIEVKLSYRKSQTQQAEPWFKIISEALNEWLVKT